MNVGELVAALLRLPQQATVCLPAEAGSPGYPHDYHDPHEVVGTSRWHGDYIDASGYGLIRGPYIRIDAAED